MCDVIQMGEVAGHVESQLLHTSYANCYVQFICVGTGENKICQETFPVKQLLDSFSHHLANAGPSFQGLTVQLISVSSSSKCSNVRIRCRNCQNQNLFCWTQKDSGKDFKCLEAEIQTSVTKTE